jgi:hypothetical protein
MREAEFGHPTEEFVVVVFYPQDHSFIACRSMYESEG